VTPRPTKHRKATALRKRRSNAREAPVVVDLSDSKWAELRAQLADATVLSAADSAAVRHWIETGKGRPPCV